MTRKTRGRLMVNAADGSTQMEEELINDEAEEGL